jgi:hypothetical protein
MNIRKACIALGIVAVEAACSKKDASPSEEETSSPRNAVPREPAIIPAVSKTRLGAALAGLQRIHIGVLLLALATGCGSAPEPSPPIANDVTLPVRASLHLPGAGFMTDATLLSPASDGLQVTVVDAQGAAALRRALAKWHHPTLQVPPDTLPSLWEIQRDDLPAERITWRIPVGRDQTVVAMAVSHFEKAMDVDLLCDGERIHRRVPPAHSLLVHGFPTNAALMCLFEFDRALEERPAKEDPSRSGAGSQGGSWSNGQ